MTQPEALRLAAELDAEIQRTVQLDMMHHNAALEAALAQQAEPVEPVAWSGYDLDGMVEAFSRVIESHYQRANPFQNPIDMDAQMALRILRGFIPAMKAYAALAQQAEPVQEPVAWRDSDNSDPGQGCTYDKAKAARWSHIYKQPLYTAPLQRKPLTEEEIAAEWQKASECASKSEGAVTTSQFVQMFARAIERAHGIKE